MQFSGRHLALTSTLLALLMLWAPILPSPLSRMVGNFQSEIYTHAPPLAASLTGLAIHGPFVRAEHPSFPTVSATAALEPATVLLLLPGYGLLKGTAGFALGWNLWMGMVLVGSAWGAWLGARALWGDKEGEWGPGLAVAITASSLFLHRFADAGRTEAQNYPLYALHLGLLLHAALRESSFRNWGWAAVSALPVLWSGGYGAAFFALTEPWVALWLLWLAGDRKKTLVGLGMVAVVAVGLVAPLQWALAKYPYVGVGVRSDTHRIPSIDLSLFLTDSFERVKALPGYEVVPFVGWGVMVLGVVGAILTPRARIPLTIAVLCLWGAAGPEPVLAGVTLFGPTTLWSKLGMLSVLRGWCRLMAFSVPFFALAAGGSTRRSVALVGALVVLGETELRAERSWWSLDASHQYSADSLVLPLDNWGLTRRWLMGTKGLDAWSLSPDQPLLFWVSERAPAEPDRFRGMARAEALLPERCEVMTDAVALGELGFVRVVVREEWTREGLAEDITTALVPFLGERSGGVWSFPTQAEGCQDFMQGNRVRQQDQQKTPAERAAARQAGRAAREAERRQNEK